MGFKAGPVLDRTKFSVGSCTAVTGNTVNLETCFLPFGVISGVKGARGDGQPGAAQCCPGNKGCSRGCRGCAHGLAREDGEECLPGSSHMAKTL